MDEQKPKVDQDRESLVTGGDQLRSGSGGLSPNDHLSMMLELCKPESMGMVRRWVSALMLVPEGERAGVVRAVEKQIVEEFGS